MVVALGRGAELTTRELIERVHRESRFTLSEDALSHWVKLGLLASRSLGQGQPANYTEADASLAVKYGMLKQCGCSTQELWQCFGHSSRLALTLGDTPPQLSDIDGKPQWSPWNSVAVRDAAREMAETGYTNPVDAMQALSKRKPGLARRLDLELTRGGVKAHDFFNLVWGQERNRRMANQAFETVKQLREDIEQGIRLGGHFVSTEPIDARTAREQVADARKQYVAEARLAGREPARWEEWPRLFSESSPKNAALIRAADAELNPESPEARAADRIYRARESADEARLMTESRQARRPNPTVAAPKPKVSWRQVVVWDERGSRVDDDRRIGILRKAVQDKSIPPGVHLTDGWNRAIRLAEMDGDGL